MRCNRVAGRGRRDHALADLLYGSERRWQALACDCPTPFWNPAARLRLLRGEAVGGHICSSGATGGGGDAQHHPAGLCRDAEDEDDVEDDVEDEDGEDDVEIIKTSRSQGRAFPTGTRTLVFRVRAEYPDQLDYRE